MYSPSLIDEHYPNRPDELTSMYFHELYHTH